MSVGSLDATVAVLEAQNIPYSLDVNPYTGTLVPYVKIIGPMEVRNGGAKADDNAWKQAFTNEFVNQGYVAYCDGVTFSHGALSDTYHTSVQVATTLSGGELVALGVNGSPNIGSAPVFLDYIAYAFVVVAKAIASHFSAFAAIVGISIISTVIIYAVWRFTTPEEVTVSFPDGTSSTGTKAEQISKLSTYYCLVCPYDLFSMAEKADYPMCEGIPDQTIQIFNDHCDRAKSNSALPDWIMWIIIPSVALGGLYLAVKLLPRYMKGNQT